MTTPEHEHLDNLVKSPGWQLLQQWARSEFATRMQQHTEQAANQTDDVAALNQLRQVIAAKRAVDLVLGWPDDRLKQLKGHQIREERPVDYSRRGGL